MQRREKNISLHHWFVLEIPESEALDGVVFIGCADVVCCVEAGAAETLGAAVEFGADDRESARIRAVFMRKNIP